LIPETSGEKMGIFKAVDSPANDLLRLRVLFVNIYLYGNADEWVLVDAGLKGSASAIVKTAEQRFGKNTKPKAIILTHGHFDHVGALYTLLRHWDVPVYAHALELPYLTAIADYPKPDPSVGKGMMALMSFSYPYKAINLGNKVKLLPSDGSVPFMPGWRWIHTPGHTKGHVSLFRDADRCLIAGDAFVTTKQESLSSVAVQKPGVFGPPSYFTPDWIMARRSVEVLAALKPALALTGHGKPLQGVELLKGLQALAENFDSLALPRHGRYVPPDHSTATRKLSGSDIDAALSSSYDRS
jgi:glyoxylase-like metal-dependent hydrolase (beta-lactamase superfamily II)